MRLDDLIEKLQEMLKGSDGGNPVPPEFAVYFVDRNDGTVHEIHQVWDSGDGGRLSS